MPYARTRALPVRRAGSRTSQSPSSPSRARLSLSLSLCRKRTTLSPLRAIDLKQSRDVEIASGPRHGDGDDSGGGGGGRGRGRGRSRIGAERRGEESATHMPLGRALVKVIEENVRYITRAPPALRRCRRRRLRRRQRRTEQRVAVAEGERGAL